MEGPAKIRESANKTMKKKPRVPKQVKPCLKKMEVICRRFQGTLYNFDSVQNSNLDIVIQRIGQRRLKQQQLGWDDDYFVSSLRWVVAAIRGRKFPFTGKYL